MRPQQLDVTLELGLDVLKDRLDRVAVRVAYRSHTHTAVPTQVNSALHPSGVA